VSPRFERIVGHSEKAGLEEPRTFINRNLVNESRDARISYFDNLEPYSPDVEIWRFLPFKFFEDLMANEELHFTRADRFRQDEQEGLPPEDYIRHVMGLRRYDPTDETALNHHIGCLAQDREWFFVVCWQVFGGETFEMWKKFGEYGVAICSTYGRLKTCLDGMLDGTHLGLMRYGGDRLYQIGKYNTLQFINTKRKEYQSEQEVRAIVECPDPFDAQNRHFDLNMVPHRRPLDENGRHGWVQEFKRRRIDVKALLTGVVISPFAADDALQKANQWRDVRRHEYDVRRSTLAID
jgi:hypothetical protein